MNQRIDHTNLHRAVKIFMDNRRVQTHEEALALLGQFSLTIHVGPNLVQSAAHQAALLTLINVARSTLLGGSTLLAFPIAPA